MAIVFMTCQTSQTYHHTQAETRAIKEFIDATVLFLLCAKGVDALARTTQAS